jgi:hypothetical protein
MSTTTTKNLNATQTPVYNITNATIWAPDSCGFIAVPYWTETCTVGNTGGWVNTTVVNIYVPLPSINASFLLAHSTVWDAWAHEFAVEIAFASGIPAGQFKVTWAGRCPATPTWMGFNPFDAAGPNVDCATLEFTEEPGAALALGLTARAALYRVAAVIGATAPSYYFGAFIPQTLASAGINPTSALLFPLWVDPRVTPGGAPINVLAIATFSVVTWPNRRIDSQLIPGGPSIWGRANGRLIDLPGLRATSGLNMPAPPFNAGPLTAAVASFVTISGLLGLALAFLWRAYSLTGKAPRPPARRMSVSRAGSANEQHGDIEMIARSAALASARVGIIGSTVGVLKSSLAAVTKTMSSSLRGGASSSSASSSSSLSGSKAFSNPLQQEVDDENVELGAPRSYSSSTPAVSSNKSQVIQNPLSLIVGSMGMGGSSRASMWGSFRKGISARGSGSGGGGGGASQPAVDTNENEVDINVEGGGGEGDDDEVVNLVSATDAQDNQVLSHPADSNVNDDDDDELVGTVKAVE